MREFDAAARTARTQRRERGITVWLQIQCINCTAFFEGTATHCHIIYVAFTFTAANRLRSDYYQRNIFGMLFEYNSSDEQLDTNYYAFLD